MKLEYIVAIVVLLFAGQFFYGVAANPDSEFGGAYGPSASSYATNVPIAEWLGAQSACRQTASLGRSGRLWRLSGPRQRWPTHARGALPGR